MEIFGRHQGANFVFAEVAEQKAAGGGPGMGVRSPTLDEMRKGREPSRIIATVYLFPSRRQNWAVSCVSAARRSSTIETRLGRSEWSP